MINVVSLQAGVPSPLGATVCAEGVNFAVFSEHAEAIELCLFDEAGLIETGRVMLPRCSNGVWHGLLPGAKAGQVYGLRAHGPFDPAHGHRFNANKLLLDPYAKALAGRFRWTDSLLADATPDADSGRDMYRARVVADGDFDWGDDAPPATPMADTVLYEVHVKGFSQQHPDIATELRGTYGGLASPAAIAHFKRLGITALSLLPVHHAVDERMLARQGLVNYWGYSTLAYFAPSSRYARSDARAEFREMVRGLHAAGIEVILDVVYNHTAEGDQRGPTLSWRGLDNASYYWLRREDQRFYENHTGTGNTLNLTHPRVLQMVMDSLRFWVTEMHVDGFRFDLATSLARGDEGFDRRAGFLQCVTQDPVLSRVKLIAEPWDSGPGGYQLGQFPAGWSEWNDRFRDAVRSFWVSKTSDRGEVAQRIAGSSDVFRHGARGPQASINFVTAHDGFTMHDLVSYDRKHNEANGEDNRDGSSRNLSWNCGAEGPTDLLAVTALRSRLKRALMGTLLLSQGVPMLLGGDELGRTQGGNNNPFNQDNTISWFDWDAVDESFVDFVAGAIRLRQTYPQVRRSSWLDGNADAQGRRDVIWLNRNGDEMTTPQWEEAHRFMFGMLLPPLADNAASNGGNDGSGSHALLVLFNAEARDWAFKLPAGDWRSVLDSGTLSAFDTTPAVRAADGTLLLKARSLTVLDGAGIAASARSGAIEAMVDAAAHAAEPGATR